MVPVNAEWLVVSRSGEYHSPRLRLLFEVLQLLSRPGGIGPVERGSRPDHYGMLGTEDDASLTSGALSFIGYQPVSHRIIGMGAKGALSLAASTLAAFLFVPYDLKLRKDE